MGTGSLAGAHVLFLQCIYNACDGGLFIIVGDGDLTMFSLREVCDPLDFIQDSPWPWLFPLRNHSRGPSIVRSAPQPTRVGRAGPSIKKGQTKS